MEIVSLNQCSYQPTVRYQVRYMHRTSSHTSAELCDLTQRLNQQGGC
jgi:hypothetical protein